MSRSSRLFAIAAIACAAAAGAFASVAVTSRDYVVSAVHRAWSFVLDGFRVDAVVQPASPNQREPSVALVAAKAFILRLVKRDRPRVTPMWRMCPST
ncbi:hypothetical protein KW843_22755 [Acidovorax sp. sif1233]|uniref:hypothetical protein n=1 Tax=Acidovorax sp. sif1233 TaxID=2854792 RepID=UPI001C458B17|nr:hypothetical protein [Acidovorax sp. sif1233]MBV7457319.1 hypothetical protein [Acidovorax sp. sif1233]